MVCVTLVLLIKFAERKGKNSIFAAINELGYGSHDGLPRELYRGLMQGNCNLFSKYMLERQVFYLNIAGKSFLCSVAWYVVSVFKVFSGVLLVVFINSAFSG